VKTTNRPRASIRRTWAQRAVLLLLVTLAPGAPGCSSDSGGDCAGLGASRGASQPCCPSLGQDACGASLFCAAFDGRTEATCYAERSRADLTACSADIQCVSGACHTSLALCRSSLGLTCTLDVGCAPLPNAAKTVCDPHADVRGPALTCKEVLGTDGSACELATDCDSGHCRDHTCASGANGAPCGAPADCDSGQCVSGGCSDGSMGGPCGSNADCASTAPHCVDGACHLGGFGDPCHANTDCSPDNQCKTAGCPDNGAPTPQPCCQ
jgi:hypothetical protein